MTYIYVQFRFELSDGNINADVKEKAATNSDRKVTFLDLVPGRLYNITVWTVSGGVPSKPLERQDRPYPEPVSSLKAINITHNQITLAWEPPQGDYDHFDILYHGDQTKHQTPPKKNSTLDNRITIGNLRPYNNYTFSVFTISGTSGHHLRQSAPISESFATKESVPGSLTSFETTNIHPSHITFNWTLPRMHANGIITGFVIEYYQVGSSYPSRKKEFSPGERQGTIMNLIPGARYVFQIRAKTQVGDGQVLDVEQEMPIWRPPKPDRNTIATELDHTMTTVTIQFRKGYFEDTHGKVKNYAIIVTEDDTKRTDQKQKLYNQI